MTEPFTIYGDSVPAKLVCDGRDIAKTKMPNMALPQTATLNWRVVCQ
jgi:hypothetical protein